jgi:hypothetical protein
VARCRDLHSGRGREVRRGGIHACGCDRAHRRISSGNAAYTPAHTVVRGVRHRGSESQLVSEHNRATRRRHSDYNGRRRWWRRGTCASSTAAQRPCSHREKSDETKSRFLETFSVASRKGPHALSKAGEWPAKEIGLGGRARESACTIIRLKPAWNQYLEVSRLT